MKQVKTMSLSDFKKLSLSERGKVVKSMAKRMNSRLSYLEKTNNINKAYEISKIYNEDNGRLNNRYSQSEKYNSLKEVNNAFKHLRMMLEEQDSSSTNVSRKTREKVKERISKNEALSISEFESMSPRDQAVALREIARENNREIEKFKKGGRTNNSMEIAKNDILNLGQKNGKFYTGLKKYENEEYRKKAMQSLIHFKNNRFTSFEKSQEIESKTLQTFRDRGINISDDNKEAFFQFLSSERFKKIGSKMSSNQAVETIAEALNDNVELSEINKAWDTYLQGNLTYKQVKKKFKGLGLNKR